MTFRYLSSEKTAWAEQGDPGWDHLRQHAQKWPKGDFPDGPVVKNPPANAGDTGLIPALGRPHMPQGI